MLEGIFKGLVQWIFGLILEIVEYTANGLISVFSMDLNYFEAAVPIMPDIISIVTAVGWALLLGNLVFQAAKSMMSGLGFEGEDPKTLFARTFVFAFLLLASRQVCEIGLGISNTVITLLQIPEAVTIAVPAESAFSIGASWLLAIIVGIVLMFQFIKLFFEIGERYFLVGLLTVLSPLAFAAGGSRNTCDIFKGWARMYGSMCLMMVLNVVLLKILLSAMSVMPSGPEVIPWLIFVVAVARVARKIDSIVTRIGLNPAITGEGLGSRIPGMLSYMVMRTVVTRVAGAAGSAAGRARTPPANPPPNTHSTSSAGTASGSFNRTNVSGGSSHSTSSSKSAGSSASNNSASNTRTSQQSGAQSDTRASFTDSSAGTPAEGAPAAAADREPSAPAYQSAAAGREAVGASARQYTNSTRQTKAAQTVSSRRSSVIHSASPAGHASRPAGVGAVSHRGFPSYERNAPEPARPPIPRPQQTGAAPGASGAVPQGESQPRRPARFSVVPMGIRQTGARDAGTVNSSRESKIGSGAQGTGSDIRAESGVSAEQSGARHEFHSSPGYGTQASRRSEKSSVYTSAAYASTADRRSADSREQTRTAGHAGTSSASKPTAPGIMETEHRRNSAAPEPERTARGGTAPASSAYPQGINGTGARMSAVSKDREYTTGQRAATVSAAPVKPAARHAAQDSQTARQVRESARSTDRRPRQTPYGSAGTEAPRVSGAVKKPDISQGRPPAGQGTARIDPIGIVPKRVKGKKGVRKKRGGKT